MASDKPKISDATKAADRADAETTAHADRMPTSEEEAAAEKHTLDPDSAASIKAATERGANARGEGRIEQ